MIAQSWMLLLSAYLLGSVPTAYLVTRFLTGMDIRQLGDGNVGAKNTFESVGWLAGVVVALADVAKGMLTVMVARYFAATEEIVLLAGLCAILGHDFSMFLKFHGGQGMATTVGVFGALFPQETAVGLAITAVVFAITRHWDMSWGVGFGSLVVMMWLTGQSPLRLFYVIILLPIIGLKKLLQIWQRRHVAV